MANQPPDDHQQQHRDQRKMGVGMFVLAWGTFIILAGVFFSDQLNFQQNPNQKPEARTSVNGIKEIVLQPNRHNHYVLNGLINGHPVMFLLDTGATDVVIPQNLANTIGLQPGRKQYARTANGTITVFGTNLDSVDLGGILLSDIRASINPAMADKVVLLGMSALKQIEFTQRGDTLILRQ